MHATVSKDSKDDHVILLGAENETDMVRLKELADKGHGKLLHCNSVDGEERFQLQIAEHRFSG